MWPFEHHHEGKVHLHLERWTEFKKQKEAEYPHNWLHNRLFMLLHSPRPTIRDFDSFPEEELWFAPAATKNPVVNAPTVKRAVPIQFVSDNWSVIFEPYPAWQRTVDDPDGLLPSYHLWAEDRHPQPTYGEPIIFYSTSTSLSPYYRIFAGFRGQIWLVNNFVHYGLGTARPTREEIQIIGTKKKIYRSIDED